jgi:hypothetical protein
MELELLGRQEADLRAVADNSLDNTMAEEEKGFPSSIGSTGYFRNTAEMVWLGKAISS